MPQGRILSDKGTHYMQEVLHWKTGLPTGHRQRVQRYLCVGGPLAGVHRSSAELSDENQSQDYRSYNVAGGRRGKNNYSMIFVHKDLLP